MAQYYKSSPEIEQKKKKLVLTAVRKFKSQLDESSCATNGCKYTTLWDSLLHGYKSVQL